jgi:hypothetical protein
LSDGDRLFLFHREPDGDQIDRSTLSIYYPLCLFIILSKAFTTGLNVLLFGAAGAARAKQGLR